MSLDLLDSHFTTRLNKLVFTLRILILYKAIQSSCIEVDLLAINKLNYSFFLSIRLYLVSFILAFAFLYQDSHFLLKVFPDFAQDFINWAFRLDLASRSSDWFWRVGYTLPWDFCFILAFIYLFLAFNYITNESCSNRRN